MESLSQIATLPPVPEEEDDPDLGPPDDSPQEITQSEPETNIIQTEVAMRQNLKKSTKLIKHSATPTKNKNMI